MAQQALLEQRSQVRHLVPLSAYDQVTGKLLGCTDNIHEAGLMLVSKNPVPVKKEIQIILEVPGQTTMKKISLDTFTAWSSISDSQPTFYYTGFYFISPSSDALHNLKLFIKKVSIPTG